MRIEDDIKLDFPDVLIKPKPSDLPSRLDVKTTREFSFRYGKAEFDGVPIMAANMDGVGTFSMAREMFKHKVFTVIRKHYTLEDWIKFGSAPITTTPSGMWKFISVCTGSNAIWSDTAEDYQLVKDVIERFPVEYITVDVANGYQANFVDFIKRVRDDYPDKVIIAGNVITGEMVSTLIMAGADIVKCGIGPGSVCTTRIKTGVGYPQLSGIIECADAAHGLAGGKIIADGGCVTSGDVAKAFGANADFVMLGGMLAGHLEGEYTETKDGKVTFYGMSSDEALAKHGARRDGYRASEGRVISLPYRGPVENTITEIIGGIGSSCTYTGAHCIKDMGKCTTFVRVNNTHNLAYAHMDTGRS